jgi:hypothetical protein
MCNTRCFKTHLLSRNVVLSHNALRLLEIIEPYLVDLVEQEHMANAQLLMY